MDNMTIISKLIPIAVTCLWVAGAIAVIKNVARGRSWKDQLLALLAIGVASVFIMSCSTVFTFTKNLIDTATSFITAFNFGELLK